jgi:hypothetical protein
MDLRNIVSRLGQMASDVKLSANLVSQQISIDSKAEEVGRYTGTIGRFEECRFNYDVAKASYSNFDR